MKACKILHFSPQLEEVEITVADHVQPMKRSNFAVTWEQIGDQNENEDTYALSTVHTLQGSFFISFSLMKKSI